MMPILTVLSLINQATGVIAAFKGGAVAAKVSGAVQDAVQVIGVLTPLVKQFGDGEEVTEAHVRAALDGMHNALASFDAEIAKAEAAGG
jgi:hypothetical protein